MTGPENTPPGTRPISVAELLAKNGTIGAPPVGGRRRRRRGNSDAVTVAELTGEIPIITDDIELELLDEPVPVRQTRWSTPPSWPPSWTSRASPVKSREQPQPRDEARARNGGRNGGSRPRLVNAGPRPAEPEDVRTDAEDDYDARPGCARCRSGTGRIRAAPASRAVQAPGARLHSRPGTGAERMSPDPLYDLDEGAAAEPADALVEADVHEVQDIHGADTDDTAYDDYDDEYGKVPTPRSARCSAASPVADDMARRPRGRGGVDDLDELDEDLSEDTREADAFDEHDEFDEEQQPSSPLVRALWIVGQCVLAVALRCGSVHRLRPAVEVEQHRRAGARRCW